MSNYDHIYLGEVSDTAWQRVKWNLFFVVTKRSRAVTDDFKKLIVVNGYEFQPYLDAVISKLSELNEPQTFAWSYEQTDHMVTYKATVIGEKILLHEPIVGLGGESYAVTEHFVVPRSECDDRRLFELTTLTIASLPK